MLPIKRHAVIGLLGFFTLVVAPGSMAKGLEDMPPPAKVEAEIQAASGTTRPPPVADGLTPPAAEPAPETASEPAPTGKVVAAEPEPELSKAERLLVDNLVIGTSINMVWPQRSGSGWNASGSGRTGSSDLLIGVNVPLSVLGLRKNKSNKIALKGTFRYNPIVVAGVQDAKPYRGVWDGYHAGLEAHLKYPPIKGMTAIAGVEAGLVFVYLDPLDDFETPKSAEATGVILTAHAGGDWEVAPKITVGPRIYLGFGGFQNLQIGAATNFAF